MLRHAAAPGDPEYVDAPVAQFGEHPEDQPHNSNRLVNQYGPGGCAGAADAGRVEADDVNVSVEFPDVVAQHLQADADAVDQQQRGLLPAAARPGRTATRILLAVDDDAAPWRPGRWPYRSSRSPMQVGLSVCHALHAGGGGVYSLVR